MAPPRAKKAKQAAPSSAPSPLAQLRQLEAALLPSAAGPPPSLNPLVDLLRLTTTSAAPDVVHKGVYACGRVFAYLASQGRVTGVPEQAAGAKAKAGADEGEEKVRRWLADRLAEWVTFCQGLMKDVEGDLRAAGLANLLGLLPAFSAALPSSASSSSSSSSPQQPTYPAAHLRALVQPFLTPTPSTRGGSTEFTLAAGSEEGEGLLAESDMVEKLGQEMATFRDIRWAVYRELSYLLRPHLAEPSSAPAHLAPNVFAILSTQTSFPSTQKALEKVPVFLPGFSTRPFLPAPGAKKAKAPVGEEEEDDWRTYFDSDPEESDDGAPQPRGPSAPGKGKRKASAGAKKGEKRELGGRVKQMTTWEGIWSLESLRAGFTSAWMALLSLPLDASVARQVLVILHHQVLPNMTAGRAVRTADWLGEWVDRGGPLGLLALNGLFILITQYNLDYPDFYTKLYAMVDRAVLHVKYRARFFRLTETFLSSSHLPATLIASFAKRLSRLALSAPPAGAVIVLPFVYNLLKMHPACMVLVHRDTYGGEELSLDGPAAMADPYNPSDPSPLTSRALDSSLWELAALQKHYLSTVGSLAKIFGEAFTKPRYAMEDFLDHTYMTMFDTEARRHLKNDPALALPVEGVAFPPKCKRTAAGEDQEEEDVFVGRDAVADLWTF